MKIEIKIDVTRETARRIAVVSTTLIAVGVGAAVYANQIRFTAGETLTAANLNNNFDELYAKAAKPSVTVSGKSISLGAVYCGSTAAKYTGSQVGGYEGAKAKCEATCSSTTAHLCTREELMRSLAVGVAAVKTTQYSYSAGTPTTDNSNDCIGWTSDLGHAGLLFSGNIGLIPGSDCGTAYPLTCCD